MTTSRRKRRVKKEEVNEQGYVIEEDIDFNTTTSSFDVNKYTIGTTDREITLLVGPDEDELVLTVKDMAWSKRNRIISSCVSWDNVGQTNFDGDAYVRQCLKEIIVNAPWGATTEAFLVRINADLGTALETLVPSAFETNTMEQEVDDLKKGP